MTEAINKGKSEVLPTGIAPLRAIRTRRGRFLSELDRLLPWASWVEMITPYYPKPGNGRRPYPLFPLLRLHLLQTWFDLSDSAAEELAIDSVSVRNFLGFSLTWDCAPPDESTLAKFRRLLSRHGLSGQISGDVLSALDGQNWRIKGGKIEEAALFAERCK